jgi:glycerophosphoryl diester phosphodiesterase
MGAIAAILGSALRDFRACWRTLLLTDLACKLAALAVLTPAVTLLVRWALSRTGTAVVADTDIATFFLTTRPGLIALVAGASMVAAIAALELSCLMAVGLAAANDRRLTVRGALAFGVSRAFVLLQLMGNMVAHLIVGLVPFAFGIGAVYWTLLRYHDINFYLSQRPPAFWVAVGLAAVILTLLLIVLLRTLGRWSLALPLVLFENVSPRLALKTSGTRTIGMRLVAIGALVMWAAIAAVVFALAAWAPEAIGRSLAGRYAGSMQGLLTFVTILVAIYASLGLLATLLNASLLALVVLRLYIHGGPAQSLYVPGTVEGEPAPRMPLTVKLAAALVLLLAAAAVTLLALGVDRQSQPVRVIAHRGSSIAAPENTLAAFRLAADQAADFVELDVQESVDGEVLVVHDSDLMKVGGSPLKIWESTAADLRAIDIGSRRAAQFSSERVPTLAEVLALCKGRVRVVVELKSYGHAQRLEERVIEVVEAAGMERETIFMSLEHSMSRRIKELRPSWRVGLVVARAMGDLTTIGADFLAVETQLATRAFVRRAHAANQEVYVWTVNDPASMLQLVSRGVDGVITDRPDLAREVIDRRARMSDVERTWVALMIRLGVKPAAIEQP